MSHAVRAAGKADEAAVADVLALGFSADPVTRWTWPDARHYLGAFPRFVRAFGGKAFEHGGAHCTADLAGAALWLPPGIGPDEDAMGELLETTVPERVRKDVFGLVELMGGHHPKEPHWYLPLIAVDPSRQGRGYGGALLRHGLAACDRGRSLAYLESTNPRNMPLYERHGFELTATLQVGSSPPLFAMLRKPDRG